MRSASILMGLGWAGAATADPCEESDAGFPAFVNLIGIESPGLTASPAIAERVVELLSGV